MAYRRSEPCGTSFAYVAPAIDAGCPGYRPATWLAFAPEILALWLASHPKFKKIYKKKHTGKRYNRAIIFNCICGQYGFLKFFKLHRSASGQKKKVSVSTIEIIDTVTGEKLLTC